MPDDTFRCIEVIHAIAINFRLRQCAITGKAFLYFLGWAKGMKLPIAIMIVSSLGSIVMASGVTAYSLDNVGSAHGSGMVPRGEVQAHDPVQPVPMAYAWNDGPAPAADRHNVPVLLKDGTILALGVEVQYPPHGLNDGPPVVTQSERYDPVHQRWSAVAPMLQGYPNSSDTATLLMNGQVLVVGAARDGMPRPSDCELFDPATGSWKLTTGPAHSVGFRHFALLLPDGNVLIAGGFGSTSCQLYDPKPESWSEIPSMREDRTSLLLLSNGKVLASGGMSCELYDPTTRTWSATGSMITTRSHHSATLLNDGRVLITGGVDIKSRSVTSSCEIYDPQTGIWSATMALPRERGLAAVAKLTSGHVLVIGGVLNPGRNFYVTGDCEEYDPGKGTWGAVPVLKHARYGHSAIVLNNGQIMIMDGVGGGPDIPIEIYGPAPTGMKTGDGDF